MIRVLCPAIFPLTLVKIFPVGVLWFRCSVCDLLLVWIFEWAVGWAGLLPSPPCTSIGANAICGKDCLLSHVITLARLLIWLVLCSALWVTKSVFVLVPHHLDSRLCGDP